jgi:hypothetical protein
MNIAVFGWYHHRNAGDDRMQYCITRWLDGHTLAFLPAGRPPPIDTLRTYDAAIIGGGGLIMGTGGLFRNVRRWVRAAGIPVALLGVSVERMTPELHAELRDLLDVCCFAWFRDQGSLEEVGPHPRAFVAPDLTWLYPYPQLPAAGEALALSLRFQRDLPLKRWRAAVAGLRRRVLPWPLYFEQGGDTRVLAPIVPGAAIPDQFTLDPLLSAAMVVSGRYHGLLFALQSGRPVIGVSDLPKTRRFLADHSLSEWCIGEQEPERLHERLQQLEAQHERLVRRALELRQVLCAAATHQAWQCRDQLLDAVLVTPSRRWGKRVRMILDLGRH